MTGVNGILGSFLLAFPALFSIVNPIAGALIYSQITGDRSHEERVALARRIGLYSAMVMLGALWIGAAILSFFGITLSALRIAGGLVVSIRAWEMLSEPHRDETRKQEQALPATDANDIAFFPLTMPFTTGPGTISVAIALSTGRPDLPAEAVSFYIGISAAALAMAACVALSYAFADRLTMLLGQARSRIVTRMSAFLLLCIGIQILITGVNDAMGQFMARRLG